MNRYWPVKSYLGFIVSNLMISVNTKNPFKKFFFFLNIPWYAKLNLYVIEKKKCWLGLAFLVSNLIWFFCCIFFYDTFDNNSFQVYAKVSVITFLFIFSLDLFMICLLVFRVFEIMKLIFQFFYSQFFY